LVVVAAAELDVVFRLFEVFSTASPKLHQHRVAKIAHA